MSEAQDIEHTRKRARPFEHERSRTPPTGTELPDQTPADPHSQQRAPNSPREPAKSVWEYSGLRLKMVEEIGETLLLDLSNATTFFGLLVALNGLIHDLAPVHPASKCVRSASDKAFGVILKNLFAEARKLYQLMAELHNLDPIHFSLAEEVAKVTEATIMCKTILEDSHPKSTGRVSPSFGDGTSSPNTDTCWRNLMKNAAGDWIVEKRLVYYSGGIPEPNRNSLRRFLVTGGLPISIARRNKRYLTIETAIVGPLLAFWVYIAALQSKAAVRSMLWMINLTFGLDVRRATEERGKAWRSFAPEDDAESAPLVDLVGYVAFGPSRHTFVGFNAPTIDWGEMDDPFQQWLNSCN